MLHIERPTSLDIRMPLSTRVMLPVVSALEQISLHSNGHTPPPPPPQGEDMVTDKDQAGSQMTEVRQSLDRPMLGCHHNSVYSVG